MFRATVTALAVFCAAMFVGASSQADEVHRAANFTLTDFSGKSWTLYELKDVEAVVIYVHGIGCPIVRQSVPDIEAVKAKYADNKVQFLMLNANPADKAADLKQDAADFSITIPILIDEKQEVARGLGVERTATVYVIDPQADWRIVYKGAVDNRRDYGVVRQHGIEHWLDDALAEHLAGKPVSKPETQPKGCLVNYLVGDDDAPDEDGALNGDE